MKRSYGFIHPNVIAPLCALIVVAGIGWIITHKSPADTKASTAVAAPVKTSTITTTAPSSLNTKSDVQKAIQVTNSSTIDVDLDTSGFDADINALDN